MILSHGVSSIKGGFLFNREILDKNLLESSLMSEGLIYDPFTIKNIATHEYIVPPALKKNSELANGKYKLTLEERKKKIVDLEKSKKTIKTRRNKC